MLALLRGDNILIHTGIAAPDSNRPTLQIYYAATAGFAAARLAVRARPEMQPWITSS
jgi:hypothetical protein